jgi:hypothetical protein
MFQEEAGLRYRIHPVNIRAGDQFKPDFLRIRRNNRMPAIIDSEPSDGGEPVSVFSGRSACMQVFGRRAPECVECSSCWRPKTCTTQDTKFVPIKTEIFTLFDASKIRPE